MLQATVKLGTRLAVLAVCQATSLMTPPGPLIVATATITLPSSIMRAAMDLARSTIPQTMAIFIVVQTASLASLAEPCLRQPPALAMYTTAKPLLKALTLFLLQTTATAVPVPKSPISLAPPPAALLLAAAAVDRLGPEITLAALRRTSPLPTTALPAILPPLAIPTGVRSSPPAPNIAAQPLSFRL
jgi:hypothetical protein